MTCILVAHLGTEVIIAADKRVTLITPDGSKAPIGDGEEKIVRTPAGVITGAGSVAMLDHVKNLVRLHGFNSSDEVLGLILDTRKAYSEQFADSPRLQADLAETSWMFTYPVMDEDKAVTRFVYYLQSRSTELLCGLKAEKAMCFSSGLSAAQVDEVLDVLQDVVTTSLEIAPPLKSDSR